MDVYVYESVDDLTDNYHPDGGLVIITDRNPLDAFNEASAKKLDKLPAPTNIIKADTTTERVYVFPDTGCC